MVPAYLATSPIISDGSALMESQLGSKGASRHGDTSPDRASVQTLGPSQSPGSQKKRRKRRRKSKVDSMRRDDNEGYSEDEDMFTIDMSSDEEKDVGDSR